MLPGVFQDKITPVIDYADKAVDQCDVRVVKILFVGAGNLHMITNKIWCEYLCIVSVPTLVYKFNFLKSWSI